MPISKQVKVGLIGCGSLGSLHARNIESCGNAILTALCSRKLETAIALSDELHSSPKPYDDYRKMMETQDLDAVCVVTPNNTHYDIVLAAAEYGLHVFCEKPMALRVEDCDEMMAAMDKSGAYLMLGYMRRFEKKYQLMKKLIDECAIGELHTGSIQLLYTRPQQNDGSWVHNVEQYGGLYSLYSHEIDQLNWMTGEVTAVQAMLKYNQQHTSGLEECVCMNLQFASGVLVDLQCNRMHPGRKSLLELTGSNGSLKIEDGVLSQTETHGEVKVINCEANDPYKEELRYFINCIQQQKPPEPNGRDGRRTIVVAEAAEKSSRSGQTVIIPSVLQM